MVNTIKPDGTWSHIDYEDVSNEGFQHSEHTANMVTMARAYKKGSAFIKAKSKTGHHSGFQAWVENDYICKNWWHNEVGTPTNLVNLMLLIGDELPKDLVEKDNRSSDAHIDGPGARPGGDRIKIAGIQAKNMLFTGDLQTFNEVIG